ncbi:MAG TPA: ABC transporter permease subunit [Candidatus Acidoferrum sp.]|nr:ABC transporter permease subunit [Candidatus Acidoferrum sp.]
MRRSADALILIGGLLLGWQVVFVLFGDMAITSPWETLVSAVRLLGREQFWPHLTETAKAFGAGLAIAIAGGLLLGLTLGFHRLSGEVLEPILTALYSIPKVTLYPVILLIFGIGLSAKVAFGTIHGVVPIVIFTMDAVRNIKPVLMKTGRLYRLSPAGMARTILIPAALPEIFTGLRVGFSLTLIGTLIGEMFGGLQGIGFLLMRAIGLHDVKTIMGITLLLVVFAAGVNTLLLTIDHRLHQRTV